VLVVDTSAWVEWICDSPTAGLMEKHWPSAAETIVPTIVQLELAKWLMRHSTAKAARDWLAYTATCLVAPLDTGIAYAAAEVCLSDKIATADAIIFATAPTFGARLLTCDAHFRSLSGIIYVPKAEASAQS
jgi:uncharacterized protein